MFVSCAVLPSDIERAHRIGRKTDTSIRPRPVIVSFRLEVTRSRVLAHSATYNIHLHVKQIMKTSLKYT